MTLLIPRILHQIWLGPNSLPEDFAAYRETWREHNPGWTLELWSEDRLPNGLRRPEVYDRLRVPAERADILRLEVLWRFGGVYVDTDFECRRSIEPLIDGIDFFTAYLKPGRVNNAIIGAIPGHPILDRALSELRPNSGYGYDKHAAGPLFLDRLVKGYPEITIFEPEMFYPSAPGQRSRAVAIHHAARSWKDTEGFRQAKLKADLRRRKAISELGLADQERARLERRLAKAEARLERARAGERVGPSRATQLIFACEAVARRSRGCAAAQTKHLARTSRRRSRRLWQVLIVPLRASASLRPLGVRRQKALDLRVPRIVHHVWLGADPLPSELKRARRSWRAARGWARKVWTDANLPDDLIRPQAGEFLRSPGERLQFLRLELLHRFGGVVLDPDLVCRGSLEPLLDGLELAAASFADGRADESLLAAVPRHPIVERLLRELPAAAYWGAEQASVGERLTHEATKGAEHIMLLPPTAVTGPEDATVDTVAVRLYEREQVEDDPRGTALAAEADLAAAQAELEDAHRRTHDLRARQKRVDLELASFRRRSGREVPRPADPP